MAFFSCRHHILVVLSLISSTLSIDPKMTITAPHSVTAFTRTLIQWSLATNDAPSALPTIGIWISSIGYCPDDTVRNLGVVTRRIDLHGGEGMANFSGSELMVVSEFHPNNMTALVCGYQRDDSEDPWKYSLLNHSAAFRVTFPEWPREATVTPTETSTSLSSPISSSSPDSKQASNLSTADIVGIAVGSAGFVGLLAALLLVYRRIRYQRRLNSFHNERMTMKQAPLAAMRVASPTTRDSVGAQTIFSQTEVSTDYGKKDEQYDDSVLPEGKNA